MPNTPTYATVMNRANDDIFSTLKYHVPLGPFHERLPVDELNVMKGIRYIDSPWTSPIPELCPGIRGVSKSDNHTVALKAMFLQHLHEQHTDDEIIYTDGFKTETGTGVYLELGLFSVNSLIVLLSIQQNYWPYSMFLFFWYWSQGTFWP